MTTNNNNSFIQNDLDLVKDILNGRYHDHTRTIFKCVFPDYENLPNYLKPNLEELKRVLFRSDPSTLSSSTVIAESNRLKNNEPSVVNDLTFEIADISTQLNASNPARIATEHMIDYLFDDTDDFLTLPKVVNKKQEVNITKDQAMAVLYKVYEEEPIYNSTGNHFHLVDSPSSENEINELYKYKFKLKEFTEEEKNKLKMKDILIIETLKSYTVDVNENGKMNNDTDLIGVISDMMMYRISGDLITFDYLQSHHEFILKLAISVLEKLDKKYIGYYAPNYASKNSNKLRKRYIPLTKVLDKMILELMLIRKYLDYEYGWVVTISDVANALGFNKHIITEVDYQFQFHSKLSLKNFQDYGYSIGKSTDLELTIDRLSIKLPIITKKWLSYNNIFKRTADKYKWFALITTLQAMLENEASRSIYKECIGVDPDVLFTIRVPNLYLYILKDYQNAKLRHDYQLISGLYSTFNTIKSSPIAAITGTVGFVLSLYNLIKDNNMI